MDLGQDNLNIKTFTLTQDEPIMGCIRNNIQINFSEGDQILVRETKSPTPGSLIVVKVGNFIKVRRFEKLQGNDNIFPPLEGIDSTQYSQIILGQIYAHNHLNEWTNLEAQ